MSNIYHNEGDDHVERSEDEESSSSNNNTSSEIRDERKSIQLTFGEQLQDDIINSFCDRLQAVCPLRIDGLLAIQFLTCEPENVKKHISGKNDAVQVLYEKGRSHYILTHYKPSEGHVAVYDSLQIYNAENMPTLSEELCSYVKFLYGHLFSGSIPLVFDRNFERQQDDFSCGYRSIGALVDISRGIRPGSRAYSRSAILQFVEKIVNIERPAWEEFASSQLYRTGSESKEQDKGGVVKMYLQENDASTGSSLSTTYSRQSSRASSFSSDVEFEARKTAGEENEEHDAGYMHMLPWPKRDLFCFSSWKKVLHKKQLLFSDRRSEEDLGETRVKKPVEDC